MIIGPNAGFFPLRTDHSPEEGRKCANEACGGQSIRCRRRSLGPPGPFCSLDGGAGAMANSPKINKLGLKSIQGKAAWIVQPRVQEAVWDSSSILPK